MLLETLNFILIVYRFLAGLSMRESVYGSQWWKEFIHWKCTKHRRLLNAATRIQANNAIHPACHLHLLPSSLNPALDGLINLYAQKITGLVDHHVVQLINLSHYNNPSHQEEAVGAIVGHQFSCENSKVSLTLGLHHTNTTRLYKPYPLGVAQFGVCQAWRK